MEDRYERLEELKVEDEVKDRELSIAQKKALIKEAKKMYGPNWKKILGIAGNIRVNSEALHSLYSVGNSELRDMNNPIRRR